MWKFLYLHKKIKKKDMEKGCVYFLKHKNMTPIKIGYTTMATPLKRFNSLLTYTPDDAEIVGYISTVNPKKLESKLHRLFDKERRKGEWFEIDKKKVFKIIEEHKGISQDYNGDFLKVFNMNKKIFIVDIFRSLNEYFDFGVNYSDCLDIFKTYCAMKNVKCGTGIDEETRNRYYTITN